MSRRLAFASLLALAGVSGCASKGNACTNYGGVCQPNGVCPSGSLPPTEAQLAAANPDDNTAPYGCPADTNTQANGGAAVCCLPTDGGASSDGGS